MTDPARKNRLSPLLAKGREASEGVRIGAVVAVVLAVTLLIWLVFLKGDGDSSEPASTTATTSKSVSLVPQSGLLKALEGVGYPVYWAGPRLEVEYEVTRLPEGRTYVRYLPAGEEAGSKRAFLTVGSYQQAEALEDVRKLGQKPGAVLIPIAGGGSAYAEGADATSAYLAFPDVDTQVEVFDPVGGKALQLVRSGAIVPIG